MKGHTKITCNHIFNLLKFDYHTKNAYTFDNVVDYLNENNHVKVENISAADFFLFEKTLDKYYLNLLPGKTNQTHVFSIYLNKFGREPYGLYKQDDTDVDEKRDGLLPKKGGEG